MWSAQITLLSPTWFGKLPGFWSNSVCFPELSGVLSAGGPKLDAYSQFGEIYHDYAVSKLADYAGFLADVAKRRKLELKSILDIACGVGTTTERLARIGPEVVGFDGSATMLRQAATRCAAVPNVRFVQGDYRRFDLQRTFSAAVSATNSLNYIEKIDELRDVFSAVSAHLQTNGLFAFDAFTQRGMRMLSGRLLHIDLKGRRCIIRFNYDPQQRKEHADVVITSGIETHARIPIEPRDVFAAAKVTGMRVCDFFSLPVVPGRWYTGALCYYLLTRI